MSLTDKRLPERELPDFVKRRLRGWSVLFFMWNSMHLALCIIGTIAATLTALKPDLLKNYLPLLAWASALCIALVGTLAPDRRARGYGKAVRYLDHACNQYRVAETPDNQKPVTAMWRGQSFVAGTSGSDDKSDSR